MRTDVARANVVLARARNGHGTGNGKNASDCESNGYAGWHGLARANQKSLRGYAPGRTHATENLGAMGRHACQPVPVSKAQGERMIAPNPLRPLRTLNTPADPQAVRTPHAHLRDDLAGEESIVWAPGFDPGTVRFVREKFLDLPRRCGRTPWRGHAGRLVGWADLDPAVRAENGHFRRRVFWVAPHDPAPAGNGGPYDRGGAPAEGVDPLTVRPGVPGVLTKRAWGRPLATEGKA